MKLNSFKLVLILCYSVLLTGCGAHGPAFSSVELTQSDKALVYIYRQASFVGGANSFKIWVNDNHVTDLKNGGYYAYMADPGELSFKVKKNLDFFDVVFGGWGLHYAIWEKQKERLKINVEAGKTYYIKYEADPESFGFNIAMLMLVDEEIGSNEIMKCQNN